MLRSARADLHFMARRFDAEAAEATLAGNEARARVALRVRLLVEEMSELCDALSRGDVVDTADALVDILYVTIGAGITFGIDLDRIWHVVHASNMAKFAPCSVDGSHGVDCVCKGHRLIALRSPSGKVIKPDGWQKPDIKAEIERQYRNADLPRGERDGAPVNEE